MADAPKIIKSHSGIGQDKFPKGLLGIRGEQEISVRSDWAGMVSSVLGSHEACGEGRGASPRLMCRFPGFGE